MRGISDDLAERIVDAHADRYPTATPEAVLLKLGEEVGELMSAVNTGRGSVAEELADVLGVTLTFAGRFFPELVIEEILAAKHRIVVDRWRAGRIDPNEETAEVVIEVDVAGWVEGAERLVDARGEVGR